MAFFQFRKGRDESAAKPAPAPTVEVVRRRAMHRLIGAAVLVLAAVIGFPLIFDSQPRPIPVDLPIEIADKNKVKPLVTPAPLPPAAVTLPAAPAPAPAAVAPTPVAAPSAPATAVAPVKPASTATVVAAANTSAAKTGDAAKAQALLEGKELASDGRFVVQVGAFADQEKVREVRRKVEGAGLKTYTQVIETKDGSRTRVRVGPFADKAAAQQVAEKISKLDLPATVLGL